MTAPKLRFKEFDGNWTLTTLNQLSTKIGDGIHATPKYDESGTIPFINGNNLVNGRIVINENTKRISSEEFQKYNQILSDRTLFLSINGTIGNLAFYKNEKVLLGKSVCYINLKNDLDKKFIYLLLHSPQLTKTLNSELTGTTIKNLSLATVRNSEFYCPIEAEQTKIASFLSAVDDKISQLTQKHQLLSQYKQGMMQKLFSQQLRFKADNGSEFGEWEEILVQYLVDKGILEKPMDGNHGEIHPTSKDYVEEGIPFVMATDIFNGKLHLEQTKKLTKQQADSLRKGFSREGDVLLTHKANIGNVAIVPQLDVEYLMLTPQVTYYRVINFSRLNNNFLKVYFESPQFQKNLLDLCTGATRLYIGISEQRKLPISLPCLEEQTKIANFLSAIDQKIEVVAQQIEQAKTWKKGLLQQMFV